MSNIAEWRNRSVLYGRTILNPSENERKNVFGKPQPVGEVVREQKAQDAQLRYLEELFKQAQE